MDKEIKVLYGEDYMTIIWPNGQRVIIERDEDPGQAALKVLRFAAANPPMTGLTIVEE